MNLFTRSQLDEMTADLTPARAMTENLGDMTEFHRDLTHAALGLKVIFRRDGLYLDERYKWGTSPHGFDWWDADRLQALFWNWQDPPMHYVYVRGDADLDAVEWMKIS